MSRKHNTHHSRSRSRYPDRLRDRGETSASVEMPRITRGQTARTLEMDGDQYAAHCKAMSDKLAGR